MMPEGSTVAEQRGLARLMAAQLSQQLLPESRQQEATWDDMAEALLQLWNEKRTAFVHALAWLATELEQLPPGAWPRAVPTGQPSAELLASAAQIWGAEVGGRGPVRQAMRGILAGCPWSWFNFPSQRQVPRMLRTPTFPALLCPLLQVEGVTQVSYRRLQAMLLHALELSDAPGGPPGWHAGRQGAAGLLPGSMCSGVFSSLPTAGPPHRRERAAGTRGQRRCSGRRRRRGGHLRRGRPLAAAAAFVGGQLRRLCWCGHHVCHMDGPLRGPGPPCPRGSALPCAALDKVGKRVRAPAGPPSPVDASSSRLPSSLKLRGPGTGQCRCLLFRGVSACHAPSRPSPRWGPPRSIVRGIPYNQQQLFRQASVVEAAAVVLLAAACQCFVFQVLHRLPRAVCPYWTAGSASLHKHGMLR